ncbi:MAG: response regulator, partial [Rhodospirillaceae bacterium]|nr:response regulator [Rhodospirillaceae bacterium]
AGNADSRARSDALLAIRDGVHKLAGSGATFGFAEVSTIARKIEGLTIAMLDDGGDHTLLAQNLSDMMQDLKNAAAQEPVERTRLSDVEPPYEEPATGTTGNRIIRSIILLENDDDYRKQMATELSNFGFNIISLAHPSELESALDAGGIHALVAGLSFNGDDQVGIEIITRMREAGKLECPIIIHTRIEDIAHRLSAVRAGARHYLIKPVDIADMVDVLDRVTLEHEEEPFRILVIDDDESLARHSELVLQGAGMTTCVLTKPLGVMEVLSDFMPELILLDLYMPDCEGTELAAIIRQQDEFDAVPIVFLSGEQDVQKQLSAMELGGDDFLTKPISPDHLISAVQIRAERFRELRSMMVKDSMTGLYNHTATKQLLSNEITRAERNDSLVSLAAIDIDFFKKVND